MEKVSIILTHFVGPKSLMLHSIFCCHWPFGSAEEDFKEFLQYHLGHEDLINKFSFLDAGRLHMKYGFNQPSGFREENLKKKKIHNRISQLHLTSVKEWP